MSRTGIEARSRMKSRGGSRARSTIAAPLLIAALAALALALPGSAAAATWAPCLGAFEDLDCAHIKLPADRTGAVAGETTVNAVRFGASEGPRLGTLFVLAGGPGQSSLQMLDFMLVLFPGANRYDLVALDQRGTGFSEPLNCPVIERGFAFDGSDTKSDGPITRCADALGPARAGYDTAEAVADIEYVRADLGVDQISLFGVSYGTKLALAYANTHPTRVRSLLLDSVLPVDAPGAFDTISIEAMRRSLDEMCENGRCKGVLGSPQSSLQRMVRQLSQAPLTGLLERPGGRPAQVKIGPAEIFELLFAADFNLYVYEQLPAAIDAALRDDPAPLVRLFAVLGGESGASLKRVHSKRVSAAGWRSAERRRTLRAKRRAAAQRKPVGTGRTINEFSNTLNVTTTCEDFTAPWPRGSALGTRQTAIDSAAAAIPDDAFLPFDRTTVKNNSLASLCRGWPESADTPALPAGTLPDVPVLALNGTLDVRTPVAWANRALAAAPRGQVVPVPHTGHSTIGTDVSGCALSLAKRFLIYGGTDGACKHNPLRVPVAGRAVTSPRSLKALRGDCSRLRGSRCTAARKVVTAGYLAMHDAIDQLAVGGMLEGPGLYGGGWELSDEFDEEMLEEEDLEEMPLYISLEGMQQVPGVIVDGRVNVTEYPRVNGDFTIIDFLGRSYEVSVSGRVGYDAADDRIRLSARSGRIRVTVSRGSAKKRSAAPVAARRLDARNLKTRIAWARATGTRRVVR